MKNGFRGFLGRVSNVALCSLLWLLTMAGACAQVATAAETINLVSIKTDAWRDGLLVTCDDAAGCEVTLSNCVVGPVPTVKLAAGEQRALPDFRGGQCASTDTALVSISILKGQPKVSTWATYRSAINVALIEIPPLQVATTGLTARLIQNDEQFETHVALFNQSDRSAFVNLRIFDSINREVGVETYQLTPGFNFIGISTRVGAGRLEVRPGTAGYGCGEACTFAAPIAGVAFVNWRPGGSARVVAMTP